MSLLAVKLSLTELFVTIATGVTAWGFAMYRVILAAVLLCLLYPSFAAKPTEKCNRQ